MKKKPLPVKIKICGMTSLTDALAAVESGADAVGFIFYKKSPRYISEKDAKKIVAGLPPFVNRVGVFVNESAERIERISKSCRLDYVQLHGEESPAFCRKIRGKVIKAIRVKNAQSIRTMAGYPVDGFLLDAYNEQTSGGTGETFDWSLVRQAKRFGPILLAGGLAASNVQEAIRKARPYAVDVCSGVEKCPGKKDPKKIAAFVRAVRSV